MANLANSISKYFLETFDIFLGWQVEFLKDKILLTRALLLSFTIKFRSSLIARLNCNIQTINEFVRWWIIPPELIEVNKAYDTSSFFASEMVLMVIFACSHNFLLRFVNFIHERKFLRVILKFPVNYLNFIFIDVICSGKRKLSSDFLFVKWNL